MLPDFRLETFFSQWEFSARYNLCASDMESMSIADLLQMGSADDRAAWTDFRLGYTETTGSPALRDAIASTYDLIAADNLLTFAGAEEGIFVAMQVLLDADDHVIVLTPNYQSSETIPLSICAVSGVPLDPDNDWHLDLDQVRAAIKPNTKLIAINFPHNPTGKVLPAADFHALVALAREHGIYIFSDEVYRLLERSAELRLPQIADVYERGLSLNVMSKAYGLPGLRIGWIATPDRDLLGRMERAKHYLSICNSGPSEFLATVALRASQQILQRNRQLVSDNLELLGSFFAEFPDLFAWQVPDGGCIGYPRYLGADGVETFCERLVEDAGVLLLPASIYGSELNATPQDRFRIGYGRRGLAEGLGVMRAYVRSTGSDALVNAQSK